jgi:enoyl-CoA hydratase
MVAAIAGHAIAGGCILALTADERLARPGATIGLNEVKIGVPLPWTVTVLMRATLPPTSWTEVALAGANFTGDEALRVGLVHAVIDTPEFEEACLARLGRLSDKEPRAFRATKRSLRSGYLAAMKEQEETHADEFVECWFAPGTTERRRQIVASLKKP